MEVVSPIIVSVAFAIACLLKLYKKQIEQAFPRLILSAWYFYLWANPSVIIETQRLMSRWAILFLALIEVISFFMRLWQDSEYNKARRMDDK